MRARDHQPCGSYPFGVQDVKGSSCCKGNTSLFHPEVRLCSESLLHPVNNLPPMKAFPQSKG